MSTIVTGHRAVAPHHLFDREAELSEIDALLARAEQRDGGALVLRGPAGIGKSALLLDSQRRAASRGMLVLSARAAPFEREFPFGVVRQLFEPVLARKDLPNAELFAGAAAGAPAALGDQPGTALAIDAAFASLHSLYWLTANLAVLAPLLIAVDDVACCDEASLRYLEFLIRRLQGMPVALALAFRTGEREPPELLAALATDPIASVLQPRSLSESAVGRMLDQAFDEQPDDAFRAACHEAAGGNPLLVVELVRALLAEGIPPRGGAVNRVRQIGAVAIGPTISRRLASLGGQAQGIATAIAIFGDSARRDDLMHLLSIGGSELDETIAALAGAHLLNAGERPSFVHPLVADAVRETVTPTERERLHQQAIKALSARRASAWELAPHILASGPQANPDAARVLREAARWSVAAGAPEMAVAYLTRALSDSVQDGDQAGLLLELGLAKAQASDPSAIRDLERAIELAREPLTKARARAALANVLFNIGENLRSIEILEAGVGETAQQDPALALGMEAQLLANIHAAGPTMEAVPTRIGDRMAGARRQDGLHDSLEGRLVLCSLSFEQVLGGFGDAASAMTLADQALTGPNLLSDGAPEPAFYSAIGTLLWCDELERAEEVLTGLFAEARDRSSLFVFAVSSAWRALVNLRLGRLLDAEADARAAIGAASQYLPGPAMTLGGSFLAATLTAQGRLDESAAAVSATPEPAGDLAITFFLVEARGRLHLARGEHRLAAEQFERHEQLDRRMRAAVPGRREAINLIAYRSLWARALMNLGELESARELVDRELELARKLGTARAIGMALHAAGLLERDDAQLELLEQACNELSHSQSRLEHAEALCDFGAALRRSNRRADSRAPLRAALQIARDAHAAPLRDRAADELKATGVRVSRPQADGVYALTASERRIASMAAAGMSNRDIAQALFITVKTVETHLGHTYRKLGVANRSQLPDTLAGAAMPGEA